MNRFIEKLPYPIGGLMLALAALGNLMKIYSPLLKNLLGAIALCIFILLVIKIIKTPKSLLLAFSQPPVAGVLATIPMTIMIFSVYVFYINMTFGAVVWWTGLLTHLVFLILFIKYTLVPFNIEKVFPSYFVIFVGIVSASISAPVHGYQKIGEVIFWFGFICYLVLLPLILYRVIKVKNIPPPVVPTLAIFAAPASLLSTGFSNSVELQPIEMTIFLYGLAFLFYFGILAYLPRLLKQKFVPSFSAFTFPFVISAINFKYLILYFQWFEPIYFLMLGIAIFLVAYVFVGYLNFMFKKEPLKA